MLANLLPGVRHVRGPLASGFLWLFFLWLLFKLHLEPEPLTKVSDLQQAVDDLANLLSPVGLGAALSFAAYVIGATSVFFTGFLQDVSWSVFLKPRRAIKHRAAHLLHELDAQAYGQLLDVRSAVTKVDDDLGARNTGSFEPSAGFEERLAVMRSVLAPVLNPIWLEERRLNPIDRYRESIAFAARNLHTDTGERTSFWQALRAGFRLAPTLYALPLILISALAMRLTLAPLRRLDMKSTAVATQYSQVGCGGVTARRFVIRV